ncbi:hypothetical protein GF406_14595 [candidate division KSB1 bacterium]|nr:hypothetical protein [candidate division KSB1 bacterium]
MQKIIAMGMFSTLLVIIGCGSQSDQNTEPAEQEIAFPEATTDDGSWFILDSSQLPGPHHTQHYERLGKTIDGINAYILKAIDTVQSKAMDGGTYFIGITADPPESPVTYNLKLFNRPLIEIPRQSSYCSGATYTAFIEAMNLMMPEGHASLSETHYEALRMQEPDGSRREDNVKFWGYWNADGFGNDFALVQYSQMGRPIEPRQCRPGDFVNISWKSGLGHSTIFLGWIKDNEDKKLLYWSSQKGTNGYGDQATSLDEIKNIKAVRLVHPENIFNFDINTDVNLNVAGETIDW